MTCLLMQSGKASPVWGQDLASELLAEGMKMEEGPLHIPRLTGAQGPRTDENQEDDDDDEDMMFFLVILQRRILKIARSVN